MTGVTYQSELRIHFGSSSRKGKEFSRDRDGENAGQESVDCECEGQDLSPVYLCPLVPSIVPGTGMLLCVCQ